MIACVTCFVRVVYNKAIRMQHRACEICSLRDAVRVGANCVNYMDGSTVTAVCRKINLTNIKAHCGG